MLRGWFLDNFNCNYVPGSSRLVRLMLISNSHLGYERCRFPKDLGVMLPEGGGEKGCGQSNSRCWMRSWIHWRLTLTLENICCCSLVAHSCPTLCDSMHCSAPGFSVHEVSQARILKWIAISYLRGSSQPGDWTLISCIGRWVFTAEPPGKPRVCIRQVAIFFFFF